VAARQSPRHLSHVIGEMSEYLHPGFNVLKPVLKPGEE
jgi:hypothetical protein